MYFAIGYIVLLEYSLSKKVLKDIIKKYGVTLISLGNGTASRE